MCVKREPPALPDLITLTLEAADSKLILASNQYLFMLELLQ